MTVRSLNRTMGWKLPLGSARTLNGLILEQLEDIPKPGTTLQLRQYVLEIAQTKANAVKMVRIRPPGNPASA